MTSPAILLRAAPALLALYLCAPDTAWAQDDPAASGADAPQPEAPPAARHPRGRAVLFLEADPEVDEFTRIYLYEVIAGRLRDHGLAVALGDASAEPAPPMECLAERLCGEALAVRLVAPLVIAVHLAPGLVLTMRRSDSIEPEPSRLEGEDGAVATELAALVSTLEPARLPCVVTLEADVERVTFELDGRAAPLPALVSAGAHPARARAPGRAGWSGPLRCAGGRVLRVRVE